MNILILIAGNWLSIIKWIKRVGEKYLPQIQKTNFHFDYAKNFEKMFLLFLSLIIINRVSIHKINFHIYHQISIEKIENTDVLYKTKNYLLYLVALKVLFYKAQY